MIIFMKRYKLFSVKKKVIFMSLAKVRKLRETMYTLEDAWKEIDVI